MEERYRKYLNWWFAELTMNPEAQVERYLTIFPELKSRLSKFGVGILLWNVKGLIDIDNPDDVSRVRLILKVLDQTHGFDFFDNTFNECDPETVCEIIGMSPKILRARSLKFRGRRGGSFRADFSSRGESDAGIVTDETSEKMPKRDGAEVILMSSELFL